MNTQASGNHLNSHLIEAAANGHTALVENLLEAGADANGRDPNGLTALQAAALRGQTACAKILLEAGADHAARNKFGHALAFAAYNGHTETARLLASRHSRFSVRETINEMERAAREGVTGEGDKTRCRLGAKLLAGLQTPAPCPPRPPRPPAANGLEM